LQGAAEEFDRCVAVNKGFGLVLYPWIKVGRQIAADLQSGVRKKNYGAVACGS
jgi:hypothetical protein